MMREQHCYRRGAPRIVAIGGGTGLSTMLRGLKLHTPNLTAIVTVADDGGSSGMLRQDLGIPPPGDIRNCLQALANVEPLMEDLLAYRFQDGRLAGQSFGNLFLAAMDGISPSFDQAVARMSQVLAITGQVLPVTTDIINLVAEFENGTHVRGESRIFAFKKEQDCRIQRVRLEPEEPLVLPEVLRAIAEADVILLGPGSLYTSVIPNLLVPGVADAVRASTALRVYIGNIMTQEGETEGYTLSDHLAALFDHAGAGLVDVCLANSTPIPRDLLEAYQAENAAPTFIDGEQLEKLGVELITAPVARDNAAGYARHDPERLALAIMNLIRQRTVRVAGTEGIRYLREY